MLSDRVLGRMCQTQALRSHSSHSPLFQAGNCLKNPNVEVQKNKEFLFFIVVFLFFFFFPVLKIQIFQHVNKWDSILLLLLGTEGVEEEEKKRGDEGLKKSCNSHDPQSRSLRKIPHIMRHMIKS